MTFRIQHFLATKDAHFCDTSGLTTMVRSPYWGSIPHMQSCLLSPIPSCVLFGSVFSGFDAMRGYPVTLGRVGTLIGVIYVYEAAQCPMEAIHGRQSMIHNVLSAGSIGFFGVRMGVFGIPFVGPWFFLNNPRIPPHAVAFGVYGGIAGLLATFGGKTL